jgi:hypothetical protein
MSSRSHSKIENGGPCPKPSLPSALCVRSIHRFPGSNTASRLAFDCGACGMSANSKRPADRKTSQPKALKIAALKQRLSGTPLRAHLLTRTPCVLATPSVASRSTERSILSNCEANRLWLCRHRSRSPSASGTRMILHVRTRYAPAMRGITIPPELSGNFARRGCHSDLRSD